MCFLICVVCIGIGDVCVRLTCAGVVVNRIRVLSVCVAMEVQSYFIFHFINYPHSLQSRAQLLTNYDNFLV